MEEDKLQQVIARLTNSTEHWLEIKRILEADIRANQDLIDFIDKIVKEREEKMSKLN